jgi:3'(2'), 5'-bisphosphate nucleotidase
MGAYQGLTMQLTQELVGRVVAIAEAAGREILSIYHREAGVEVVTKEGGSPLTEADMAAHHYIERQLRGITPEIPFLSEESRDISDAMRKEWPCYWLVDPLDGTKEFINRTGEFTVNIALIQDGCSVLGVVNVPVQDVTYFAAEGFGAHKKESGQMNPIHCQPAGVPVKIIASRRHGGEALQTFLDQYDHFEVVNAGSSLKICYVADGTADLYPRLGLTSEWDTAAAHCVLTCAGGEMRQMDAEANVLAESLQYTKENILNPFFLARAKEHAPG